MKAGEAITLANTLVPNPFQTAYQVRLLNQIEQRVQIDVLGVDPDDYEPIVAADINTTDLELDDRYTDVYICWLKSRYYWAMGEYEIYQNEKAMFEAEWNRWVADVGNTSHTGSCGKENA